MLTFFKTSCNTEILLLPIILKDSPFPEGEWRVNVRRPNHKILERLRQKQSIAIVLLVSDMIISKLDLFWDCSCSNTEVYFHGQWWGQKGRAVMFKTHFLNVVIKVSSNDLGGKKLMFCAFTRGDAYLSSLYTLFLQLVYE